MPVGLHRQSGSRIALGAGGTVGDGRRRAPQPGQSGRSPTRASAARKTPRRAGPRRERGCARRGARGGRLSPGCRGAPEPAELGIAVPFPFSPLFALFIRADLMIIIKYALNDMFLIYIHIYYIYMKYIYIAPCRLSSFCWGRKKSQSNKMQRRTEKQPQAPHVSVSACPGAADGAEPPAAPQTPSPNPAGTVSCRQPLQGDFF